MAFSHLHVHTVYSLLDGAGKIQNILHRVKELGQDSIAITDHGNMFGVIEFYKAAVAEGIHPVIGCEMYIAPRGFRDKQTGIDGENSHLVLLCENNTGYENLMHLCSLAWTEGFYKKPRVDPELLRQHHEGLIALSACLAGEIPRALTKNDYEGAKKKARQYAEIFGEDHFYLELQDHGIDEQRRINPLLIRLAEELQLPLAATNDCHYVRREDSRLQHILLCIQTGKNIDEPNPLAFPTDEFYIKSEEEMRRLFSHVPQAIENTARIAHRCHVELEFGKTKLPRFDTPGGKDHREYMLELCQQGMDRIYGKQPPPEVRERLRYELSVIEEMGYIDYFLIVADYVGYAKAHGIPVGAGRGSGAGSIAAYLMGITEIDPLKYDLLFERFLNPERVSMPDFDIDFCTERRQEVIDYVIRRYGEDHVAQIVAFGTMAARGAVRDVGRALNIPYPVCDKIAKMIPRDPKITLQQSLEISKELKELYDTDKTVKELIDTAQALEGIPRNTTTHAAGVVITDRPVTDYVPLAKNDDTVVTQYTMTELESLGLLKMDFLGLRNLTVIDWAVKMIRKDHPDFRINEIPIDDPGVFEMYARAETEGVFQFESKGIKNVLTRLHPKNIEDIIAVISLYRPGPMDSIPRYIRNRHDPSHIQYKHPLLEPILKVTYGCIVYQEQVMEIFRSLAGYSLGRADIVRRAMAKKKKEVMEQEKEIFIHGLKNEQGEYIVDGCIRRGISGELASEIFAEMESFAHYAFNKAHAAAYGYISYQTAYLKYHFPSEYMAALMTSVIGDAGKTAAYMDECSKWGITVLPPHVNSSAAGFTIEEHHIRFGLLAVKNIGKGLIERILSQRENGEFHSYSDFCDRVYGKDLNKRALENLIRCGALDGLGANRRQMLLMLDFALDHAAEAKENVDVGQISFFGEQEQRERSGLALPSAEEYSHRELLDMERETTGIYFSGHPLSEYEGFRQSIGADELHEILSLENEKYPDGKLVKLLCMIGSVKLKTTKNNHRMAFVAIEDKYDSGEMIVFPRQLDEYGALLTEGRIVQIIGTVDRREDERVQILCDKLLPAVKKPPVQVQPAKKEKKYAPGLYLRVPDAHCEEWLRAMQIIDIFDGSVPLYVFFTDSRKLWRAPREMAVAVNTVMISELKHRLGEKNVTLVD